MTESTHTIRYSRLSDFLAGHRSALAEDVLRFSCDPSLEAGGALSFSLDFMGESESVELSLPIERVEGGEAMCLSSALSTEHRALLTLGAAFADGAEAAVNACVLTGDTHEVNQLSTISMEAHHNTADALQLRITDPWGFQALYRAHLEPRRLSAQCDVEVGTRTMTSIFVQLPGSGAEVKLRGLIARREGGELEVELMPYTRSVKSRLGGAVLVAESAIIEACLDAAQSHGADGVAGVRALLDDFSTELGARFEDALPPELDTQAPEVVAPSHEEHEESLEPDPAPEDDSQLAEPPRLSGAEEPVAPAETAPAVTEDASPALGEPPQDTEPEPPRTTGSSAPLPPMFRRRGVLGTRGPSLDTKEPEVNRPISSAPPAMEGAIPVLHDAPVSFDRFDTSDDTLTSVEMETDTQEIRQRLGAMTGRSSSDLMGRRGRSGGSRRHATTADRVKLPKLVRKERPAPPEPPAQVEASVDEAELSESLSQLRAGRRSRPRTGDIMPSAIEESVRRADAAATVPSQAPPEEPPAAVAPPVEEPVVAEPAPEPEPAPIVEPEPPAEVPPEPEVEATPQEESPAPVEPAQAQPADAEGGPGAMSGNIASKPLLELLYALYEGSATGLLKLKGPKKRVDISVRQGRVCHIAEEPAREKYMLGTLLTTIGLSKHESAKAVTESQRSKRLIGEILLKSGNVIRSQVKQALIEQLKYRMGGLDGLEEMSFSYEPGAGTRRENAPNIDPLKLAFRGRFDHYMGRSKRENDLEGHRLAASWVRQKNFGRRWVARLGLTLPQQALWEFSESGELKTSELTGKVAVDHVTANSTLFALRDLGCLEFRSKKAEEQTREAHEKRFREKADSIRTGNYFDVLDVHWTSITEEVVEAYEHTKQAFDPSFINESSPLMEELAEVILPAVEDAFSRIKEKAERVAYRESMFTPDQIATAANYLVEQGEMELFKQDMKTARAKFSRAIELCPDVKAYKRKLNDTFTISGQQAARANQTIEHVSANTMGSIPDE